MGFIFFSLIIVFNSMTMDLPYKLLRYIVYILLVIQVESGESDQIPEKCHFSPEGKDCCTFYEVIKPIMPIGMTDDQQIEMLCHEDTMWNQLLKGRGVFEDDGIGCDMDTTGSIKENCKQLCANKDVCKKIS